MRRRTGWSPNLTRDRRSAGRGRSGARRRRSRGQHEGECHELHRDRRAAANCAPPWRGSGQRYDHRDYVLPKARAGEPPTELWDEAGKLGFLGVNLPEEYGGGGGGINELAIVQEELAAAGAGLLLLVVSPAICGTIIAQVRHRRAEAALAAPARRRLAKIWPSPSPSPTPGRTRTRSPRPRAATATTGCSTAARSSSPASTRPTPC